MHELELELRRLENEREELTAAYKEAEAVCSIFYTINLFLIESIKSHLDKARSSPHICTRTTVLSHDSLLIVAA